MQAVKVGSHVRAGAGRGQIGPLFHGQTHTAAVNSGPRAAVHAGGTEAALDSQSSFDGAAVPGQLFERRRVGPLGRVCVVSVRSADSDATSVTQSQI